MTTDDVEVQYPVENVLIEKLIMFNYPGLFMHSNFLLNVQIGVHFEEKRNFMKWTHKNIQQRK